MVSDGWSGVAKRPLINFLVVTPQGSHFLKAIDTSGESKTDEEIFNMVSKEIQEFGEGHIIVVVMDNAAANISAMKMLEDKFSHVSCIGCGAHVIDLMIEDIGKLPKVKNIVDKARELIKYFTSHQQPLSIFCEACLSREVWWSGAPAPW